MSLKRMSAQPVRGGVAIKTHRKDKNLFGTIKVRLSKRYDFYVKW